MKTGFVLILVATGLSVPCAQAVLPRDAGFRQKEVFDYRQRKQAEYEQAAVRHDAQIVQNDRNVRQILAVPPSVADCAPGDATVSGAVRRSDGRGTGILRNTDRMVLSIIALLSIGAGVYWVTKATEEDIR